MSSRPFEKPRVTERLAAAALCACLFASPIVLYAIRADVLESVDAIPAHLAGRFRDVAGFERAASGQYFIFDRRSQIVFGVDEAQASAWEIVHIGSEPGRIIIRDLETNEEHAIAFDEAAYSLDTMGGYEFETTNLRFTQVETIGDADRIDTGATALLKAPDVTALTLNRENPVLAEVPVFIGLQPGAQILHVAAKAREILAEGYPLTAGRVDAVRVVEERRIADGRRQPRTDFIAQVAARA